MSDLQADAAPRREAAPSRARPSLDRIFGEDVLIHARLPRGSRWYRLPTAAADARAAVPLVLGPPSMAFPSAGSVTDAALGLLADAGFAVAVPDSTFHDGERADEAFVEVAGRRPVAFVHVPPPALADRLRCLMPRAVLVAVNDKADLARWVRESAIPRRRVSPTRDLQQQPPPAPVVLKAVSDEPSGSGSTVAVCDDQRAVAAALERFDAAARIVVEERLTIERAVCVGGAVMPDGHVEIFGHAEQEFGAAGGGFVGTWLDPDRAAPAGALDLAQQAATRAAAIGFRGIFGVDVVETADGRVFVLDLNFRFNHSTPALLLAPGWRARWGRFVAHARWWRVEEGIAAAVRALRSGVRAGRIVPIVVHDPGVTAAGDRAAIVATVVLGDSHDDVRAAEFELHAAGMR